MRPSRTSTTSTGESVRRANADDSSLTVANAGSITVMGQLPV